MSQAENSPENEGEEREEENMKTILYAFPRESTTKEDIEKIRNVLENVGYSLSSSEGEGANILIQREEESGNNLNVSEVLNS